MSGDTPELPVSDATRAAIEAEVSQYPERRGGLLAALHLVQAELGHLAPETLEAVAAWFGIRPIELAEVVSFYNLFHTRSGGRHRVNVCTNLPCSLRGARSLLAGLESHLGIRAGETTGDGRISLGHEECLGACGYAPMLRVDDRYHEDLDLEAAKAILDGLA